MDDRFYATDAAAAVKGALLRTGREDLLPSALSTLSPEEMSREECDAMLDIGRANGIKIYDFKKTNGTEKAIDDIDIYRGMPVGIDESGTTIYTLARDVGNIMAGYVAGNASIPWPFVRLACDMYQMYSDIKSGVTPSIEGKSTRNAQRLGWQKGYKR